MFRLAAAALVFVSLALGQSPAPPAFAYGEALQKSIFFYDIQRSGKLDASNRVSWRGDSALNDGADNGVDLTGGFYDAGDHVKFGLPMASAMTMLAWGAIEYPAAYDAAGQTKPFLANLRWGMDYLLKASVTPNVLYGQVGAGDADHSFWGAAEVLPMVRPSYKITADCPGSDLAAETAAAMSAASLVFRSHGDPDYADLLLARAKSLYAFADQFHGKYSDCITDANAFYQSFSGYNDELAWGAAWLYRATADDAYLTKAQTAYQNFGLEGGTPYKVYKWTQSWDDKSYGTYVLLSELTGGATYRQDAERWLDYWSIGFNGDKVRYTPGGLAWLDQWGSLRYSANTAFLAFVYSDYLQHNSLDPVRVAAYANFGESQINYMLGNNPLHSSFVVGFGNNSPHNIHHRTGHGSFTNDISFPADSVHTVYGALVGGPDVADGYADVRTDFVKNEVALDYNAAFTGALARMYQSHGGDPLPDFPKAEVPSRDQLSVDANLNSTGSDYTEVAIYAKNETAWPARVTHALSVRYFFTLDTLDPASIAITNSYSECDPAIGPYQWYGTTYFVQATCRDVAPVGQSAYRKQTQIRIKGPGWDASNDWSMDGLSSSLAPTSKIALYDDTTLVWGFEPPRGAPSALTILTPPALPNTVAGQAYSVRLQAFGGTPSYSGWGVVDGTLPPGLAIDGSTGVVSGSPIHDGTFTFSVGVSDRAGATASEQMTLTVAPAPPLKLLTQSLPDSSVGSVYALRLQASGGVAPYTWIVANGALPSGLSLTGSTISGTATVIAASSFDLMITDQSGAQVTASFTMNIVAAPPTPPAQLRLQYRNQFPDTTSNSIGPQLKLFNDGTDPIALSQLSIRYYFTMEAPDTLNYWCDWAAVDCANVSAQFIVMGSDRICLELHFTGSGSIAAKSDSGDILSRAAKNNWTNFDQSNDYSFDATKTQYTDWDHVTVYKDGVLVWGVEPN